MTVQPTQMSIEEFYEDDRDGLEFTVNGDKLPTADDDLPF
jgi:hypothetical protein